MAEADGTRIAAGRATHFILQSGKAQNILDGDLQALAADRLHHEIARTRAHGTGHKTDRRRLHLHDGRHTQARFTHARQEPHPLHIGQNEIEN